MSDMVELEEMTNAPTEVDIRGERFEVRALTWGDRIKIEKRLGKPFRDIEYGNPQDVVTLIHVVLQKTKKELTTEQTAEMFDADNEDVLQELWTFAILDKKTAGEQVKNMRRAREELQKSLAQTPTTPEA